METQRECSSLSFMDKDGRLYDQAAPTHSCVALSTSDACRGHLGDIVLPCSHSGQASVCLSCLGAATDFKRVLMCTERLSEVWSQAKGIGWLACQVEWAWHRALWPWPSLEVGECRDLWKKASNTHLKADSRVSAALPKLSIVFPNVRICRLEWLTVSWTAKLCFLFLLPPPCSQPFSGTLRTPWCHLVLWLYTCDYLFNSYLDFA